MYQTFIKRVLDICFSLIGIVLLAVVFIPVAITIKISDPGPIFYVDKRYGKNMVVFKMLKFRSMKVNAPDIRNEDGTTFNSANDPRVTSIGRILRKTSIDELPQFINVLIGEMSVVGPRPSPLGDKSMYSERFFERYKVKPGITGYSQATLRNAATMEERITNDAYYVEHLSFMLDLKIVGWTIGTVLKMKNIHHETKATDDVTREG